jgi:hypothetical protein
LKYEELPRGCDCVTVIARGMAQSTTGRVVPVLRFKSIRLPLLDDGIFIYIETLTGLEQVGVLAID